MASYGSAIINLVLFSIRGFQHISNLLGKKVLMQGCFRDDADNHALSFVAERHENVTAETCMQQCADLGFSYASVQFETVSMSGTVLKTVPCCRCDDVWRHSGSETIASERPLDDCQATCVSATPSDYPCGSHYKQLVFNVKGQSFEVWSTNDTSDGHCAVLDPINRRWSKRDCKLETNFICEYPELTEEDCVVEGFTWLVDRCLRLSENTRAWHDATRRCARQQGYLLQCDNQELHAALSEMLGESGRHWWIGLTNRQLTWSDGSPMTYMNWSPKEPDFSREEEMCVELRKDRNYRGKLETCADTNPVLCQLVYNFTEEDYINQIEKYKIMEEMVANYGNNRRPRDRLAEINVEDPQPTTDRPKSQDNSAAINLGVGIGVAVIVTLVLISNAILIWQRKCNRRRIEQEPNDKLRVSRTDGAVGLCNQYEGDECVYYKIDDTYDRPDPSECNSIPPPYEGLGVDSITTSMDDAMSVYSTYSDHMRQPNDYQIGDVRDDVTMSPLQEVVPEPPPPRVDSYAQLVQLENEHYTVPCVYKDLIRPGKVTYEGLSGRDILISITEPESENSSNECDTHVVQINGQADDLHVTEVHINVADFDQTDSVGEDIANTADCILDVVDVSTDVAKDNTNKQDINSNATHDDNTITIAGSTNITDINASAKDGNANIAETANTNTTADNANITDANASTTAANTKDAERDTNAEDVSASTAHISLNASVVNINSSTAANMDTLDVPTMALNADAIANNAMPSHRLSHVSNSDIQYLNPGENTTELNKSASQENQTTLNDTDLNTFMNIYLEIL